MRSAGSIGCDVLVIGCGPAGAMAAASLARRGLDVVAIDKAVTPRHKLCGDFLTPGSLRLLHEGGLVDATLTERSVGLRGMKLVFDETVIRLPFPEGTTGWAIGRRDLDAGLVRAARASGVKVLEGFRAQSIVDVGGSVEALGCGRETGPLSIEARCAVDAGGRHALTPRRRGWRRPSRWPVRYAVGAWFEGVRALSDHGEMHVLAGGASGYVGISPIGDGIAGAAAVVGRRLFEPARHDVAGLLVRLLRSSADLRSRFAGARAITVARGLGPLAHGASRYGAGRLLLAGDAAAFVDPFTGEGIHAALVGGRRAAEAALEILEGAGGYAARLPAAEHERDLRAALRPRFAMSRALQACLASPPLARRVAAALSRREDLAAALVAVTGGCRDPRSLLEASFLGSLLLETASL